MDRVLMKLEDLVYDQLDGIVKQKDISPTELDNAEKAICLLLKLRELEDGEMPEQEMEYSNRYSNRRGMRSYSNGYSDGMYITPAESYRRGASMHYPDFGRHYDRYTNDGYSRHSIKDRAIDRLEQMLDEAKSESEKESVKKMIVGLEHMELY